MLLSNIDRDEITEKNSQDGIIDIKKIPNIDQNIGQTRPKMEARNKFIPRSHKASPKSTFSCKSVLAKQEKNGLFYSMQEKRINPSKCGKK